MTKAEKQHLARVAELGCIICDRLGYPGTPAEVHHIRTGIGAGRRASHYDTLPLCPEHHRGNTGLHGLGRKAFERRYSITELELLAEVKEKLHIFTDS
tara:strand:+ start:453 stop:746 length:294 start_codon:yes stop_codon:yes gene_type:complete